MRKQQFFQLSFPKNVFFIFVFVSSSFNFIKAQQKEDPFSYEAVKGTMFNVLTFTASSDGGFNGAYSESVKKARDKFRFNKVTTTKRPGEEYNIVIFSFPDYFKSYDEIEYIDKDDNGRSFWMREDIFNKLVEDKSIKKRYRAPYVSFSYGASLSLPFKMRPETKEQHMKITPEFTLGGYAGPRLRLSHYSDLFLTLPVVTLGVTTIGINDNNTIKEVSSPDKDNDDGLVLGRTFSLGAVLQYEHFQMGFIMGWDKASGEIGKKWIYNDNPWYSFSIGFSFFNASTGDNKK